MDAVQKANSGHPGMPMGMADVATVLFKNFLNFSPNNPNWINRDRFVLSAGHGSMLLYSLLYLTGYRSVSLNSIKNFRKLNSICAGHPEYHPGSGIETTTGPLGQGIANAVGFAISEEILKSHLGKKIINHKTYVIAGDGCLMEGISHEAMSLAGHLKLKNLIMLFDNNSISIDGPTKLAVSDNFKKRFESYGWNYILINGHDFSEINTALKKAQKSKKPTVISCKTTIGFGSPNKSGKASSHGSPLGLAEINLVRKKLEWKHNAFQIPNDIMNAWRKIGKKGIKIENNWNKINNKSKSKIKKFFSTNFINSLKKEKLEAHKNIKSIATRKSSELVLVSLTKNKNNKYTLCQKGGRVSCVKDLSEEDIEINKVFIPDTDYQQKQIIYLGENGNILKFLYEEENQTIPFEADISETSIISFKGAIFEIISNNNNEIEFKKIRHFRD